MKQFSLVDNVPDVYVKESRDFQLLLRLYDCIFGGLKSDIDSIQYVTDTLNIRNTLLPLLAQKIGFFSNLDLDDRSLRLILIALPEIYKNKGSLLAIKQVMYLYLKIMRERGSILISYTGQSDDITLDHSLQIGSDIDFTNLPLLNALLELQLPTGLYINYYHFASLDAAITDISQSHETFLLGKIITASSSKLRNSKDEYNWVDPSYDIREPSTTTEDDQALLKLVKNKLTGSAGILQLASSTDIIPDFSSEETYVVGDVVFYNDGSGKKCYQCILDVVSAGSWNSANWEELTYYV